MTLPKASKLGNEFWQNARAELRNQFERDNLLQIHSAHNFVYVRRYNQPEFEGQRGRSTHRKKIIAFTEPSTEMKEFCCRTLSLSLSSSSRRICKPVNTSYNLLRRIFSFITSKKKKNCSFSSQKISNLKLYTHL